MEAYIVKDFYKVLSFCWTKWRRITGRLSNPQDRGYECGPEYCEVFWGDGREV